MEKSNHYPQKMLDDLGIININAVPTIKAADYCTKILGIPTAPSSLEVYRCKGRGPKYKKINSRVYYTLPWLDKYAQGIEIKIYDPSQM